MYIGPGRAAGAALAVIFGVAADANAQTAGPTNIPLQLHNNNGAERLVINVGIAGGAAKPYLFDTGSALFNAAYNPVWWGNVPASSSLQTNVEYCYIGNSGCRGYVGNIVQVPTLSFYETSTSTTAAATLNANPGYQVNAVYLHTDPTVTPPVSQNFPGYFDTPGAPPPVEGYFYGTFGAANFAPEARIHNQPGPSGFYVGSVLGQTSVSGVAAQGYVVAANGQKNPTSDINGPQQVNGDKVKVGGQALQKITQCNPCVTLGLTSQMLGQFMPVEPTGTAGVVPWTSPTTTHSFPNPYGGATGNNSSTEFGANYTVTLTGATTPASAAGLLDTGTANVMLSQDMSAGNTTGGTLTVTGAGAGGAMVPGLTTTSMVLNSDSSSAYHATTTTVQTNTIGLPFFLQNSVLYDLSNRVIGYTPFFVTDVTVTTTSDGPLIVDATNVPLGLAGAISGAGGLTIERGGAVQLSATNNYSGPTAIAAASGGVDAGLLYISGPGSIAASSGVANDGLLDISRAWSGVQVTSLTGSGQVNLGGRILTLTNASGTFSGVIADGGAYPGSGGGLALTGGAMVLSGVNTYTGGTSVSGGATLGVVANNGLGHAGGGVTLDGGALTALASFSSARLVTLGAGGGTIDTQANTLTLTTALSGAGGLTKEGAGILILSGANSHAGGTMINAGTLRLAAGASLPTVGALIVNGGTFDLNGNDLTVSSLSGTGGTIALGSGNLIANDAGNNSLSAVITGTGGLTMSGTGTLNLTGVNTYTGPTTVSNGRLAVNGSITSNVTVGPGGILGGVGTIFGTVTGGGTTAPGNSIGTLNVVGSFTQNPGSTYQVETNATGQSDLINVTGAPGTATIAGGTVQALPEAGVYAPSTTYTILSATGGVTGTYNGVTSNLPFLQASLGYDTNNVYLTLKPGGFAAGAQTANQAAVGGVLDQSVAGSSGDFATVIGTMATLSLAQGQAAMDAISGQNYAGFSTANLGSSLLFMSVLGQQMSLARGGSGAGTRQALAQACDVTCDGEQPSPFSVWGSALGGTGSVAGTGSASTLTYNAGGMATGIDYRFNPNLLMGVGLGFASGNQWLGGFSGRGTSDSYQASLYASFTQSAFYLDALAGYGFNNNNMTRQIFIAGLQPRTAMGQTTASQFVGQAEAGYRVGLSERAAASLTPFVRLQGISNNQAGFSETGASSLNLTVAQQTTTSLRSTLGAELAGAFDLGWRDKLALQLRLGWAHEYADVSRPVTASFAGAPGAAFTVFGAAPLRDGATIGLAANTNIAERTSLYLRYDGEVATGSDSHAISAGLRMTW